MYSSTILLTGQRFARKCGVARRWKIELTQPWICSEISNCSIPAIADQMVALDQRLNQNFFVGLAAEGLSKEALIIFMVVLSGKD